MSPDEARERFSDALEEALSAEERAAFDRALAADPALAAEYRAFCDVVQSTRALGRMPTPRPSGDLLLGVQARIRKRTRGRYYRDRSAAERGTKHVLPILLAILMLLLLGIAYAGIESMDLLREPDAPGERGR